MRRAMWVLVVAGCRLNFDPAANGDAGADGSAGSPDGPTGTVTVTLTGAGAGSITGLPCSPCTTNVAVGTTLHLTAVASASSWFRGWTGGCAGRQACDVVVDASGLSLVADFTPQPNRIFISSTKHDGNLGGGVGDAACTNLAAAAGLQGTYKVLFSTVGADFTTRVGGARGWIRVDGEPVADMLSQLGTTSMMYPTVLDETGHDVGLLENAWVIHHSFGGSTFCNDWTSNSAAQQGPTFTTNRDTYVASGGAQTPCNTPARFLCAQSDRVQQVAPVAEPGRLAFTSVGMWSDSSGVPAADAICANEATGAGLSGTFKAAIATSGASALARFDLTRPWVRVDGVAPLPTGQAWTSATQFDVAIALGPARQTILYYPIPVGAVDFGTAGTAATTCNDWTSAAGSSAVPLFAWDRQILRGSGMQGCGTTIYHLLCLQQ